MATKAVPKIKDAAGLEWQDEANAAWEAAMAASDGDARAAHALYSRKSDEAPEDTSTRAPGLPDFDGAKHPSVSRRALGRFVEDRASHLVHDVNNYLPDCKVDQITEATFYHFGHEVPDDLERHTCIEVE